MPEYVNIESGNMQKNDPSAKGSASTPKPTKYRLACDSCQHSKIRCDQEKPKCRRCAKKGIECVYSPARRAGRPRTRNNSKASQSAENSASATLKGDLAPTTESGITASASCWMSPFPTSNMMSTSENCSSSSSSSSSNTSAIPTMGHTMQRASSDPMDFSPGQLSEDGFLQGLPDLSSSHCDTPKQMGNCYFSMSPEFHIAPELLDLGFCGAPWEQQPQHQQSTSTAMLLDEGLPYFGLLTPEDQQLCQHPDQHHEDPPIPTTSCNYAVSPQQQQAQPQFPQSLDHSTLSTRSCNCTSALLDHLSTPSHPSPSSYFASTSAALSTSRTLITSCSNTMACPNACYTRPSTALVICEAIDRALVALKLGGTSLWTSTLAPMPSYENGTSSSPSSSSSSSCGTSGSNGNDIMLPSADDENEPLRCGTLPIRGADRRAMVRVLLVKRVLEVQGVLERLRDMLLSGLLVSGDAAVKRPLLALCADIVGEFARKVAERVETVKLQM